MMRSQQHAVASGVICLPDLGASLWASADPEVRHAQTSLVDHR